MTKQQVIIQIHQLVSVQMAHLQLLEIVKTTTDKGMLLEKDVLE